MLHNPHLKNGGDYLSNHFEVQIFVGDERQKWHFIRAHHLELSSAENIS